MTLPITPADRPRPGPAPVGPHSAFAPVAAATSLAWSVDATAPHPQRSGRITVDLGGAWYRWADVEGDPSFPAPGARASGGVPEGVDWRRVVVPDNYGADEEHSRQFGPVWYRRRFPDPRSGSLPESPARARLRFGAVDYLADVWLNGEHLGHHEGYFAPFAFDVTDRLRRDNELVVAVQDPLEDLDPSVLFFEHRKRVIKGTLKYHDSRPGGLPGRMIGPLAPGEDPWVWTPELGQSMTTGGITGPVTLERNRDLTLDAVFVTPLAPDGATQVAAVVTNHGRTEATADRLTLHLDVAGEHVAVTFDAPNGTGRVDFVVDLGALDRWEPAGSSHGTPVVHTATATLAYGDLALDRRTVRFGRRLARVVTDDDGHARHFEVNGRPVFVKAVNYIPWQHFAEVGRSFYDRDLRMVVDAHGNSVGVHAHVQSPHCYDAADAAGVLVFQDFALQWFYDSGTETNPGFVEKAAAQIAEMGYLLYNHPSVVYYACHNEPARMFSGLTGVPADDEPDTDRGEAHLDAALERSLRSVDDSRHVHQASGIGDDAHNYYGSLAGRSLYRVGEQPAWFVSEYGFPTTGPQATKFGDHGWPPDTEQLRDWVSRLSFGGTTVAYAGLPSRYLSLAAWADATEAYGAELCKYQTEWFRAHRGAPFMGYRWHFWSDWWGYAGAGLVDVDRVPKGTYHAWQAANRPLLVVALADGSVVQPGTLAVPVVVVNDRIDAWTGTVAWETFAATSAVIAPDFDELRIGLPTPPGRGSLVAVPHTRDERIDGGEIACTAMPEAATRSGDVRVALAAGAARTVVLRWDDPELGPQENLVHLHCPAPDEAPPPGMHVVKLGS